MEKISEKERIKKIQTAVNLLKKYYFPVMTKKTFIKSIESCGIDFDTLNEKELNILNNTIKVI